MCVCARAYVYVYMYVCMHVRMYVRMYCTYASTYIPMCVYVCMYVCIFFYFLITLLNSMFHYKEAILHAGDFFTSPVLYIVQCVLYVICSYALFLSPFLTAYSVQVTKYQNLSS